MGSSCIGRSDVVLAGASATELLHDVNALILSLERVAAGLPPRPATDGRTWDDLKLAAEAAAVAAIAGVRLGHPTISVLRIA